MHSVKILNRSLETSSFIYCHNERSNPVLFRDIFRELRLKEAQEQEQDFFLGG
jgi:hypothetical protein